MELIAAGSVPGLLAAISVLMALHLVVAIGRFVWSFKEKKDAVTEAGIEELAAAMKSNTKAIEKLRQQVFSSIKLVAGDNWPAIRKSLLDEEALS